MLVQEKVHSDQIEQRFWLPPRSASSPRILTASQQQLCVAKQTKFEEFLQRQNPNREQRCYFIDEKGN